MTGISVWFADFCDLFYKCFIKDDRYRLLVSGVGVTIKVSLLAVLIGILIGMLVAMSNLSRNKLFKAIGGIYTDVILPAEFERWRQETKERESVITGD